MRKPLSLVVVGGALALFGPACSSSSAPADDTCAFIGDPNNCYRRLLAAVEGCLSDGGDGGVSTGTLSADGLSCTYASGRTVTFGGDARQYDSTKTPLDVTVAVGGKMCVHYVSQPQGSIAITQPDGATLRVAVGGLGETITCPDGSEHAIDAQKLFGGCGDAGSVFGGGLPGTTTSGVSSGAKKTVSGSLVGLKTSAYTCMSP